MKIQINMKKIDLISTEEVMMMLGFVCPVTVYKYVALGKIRKIKIGRKNRYVKSDVEEIINKKLQEAL